MADQRPVPLALRLRIKAMLDAKLTVDEIFERLTGASDGSAELSGRIDPELVVAALRSFTPDFEKSQLRSEQFEPPSRVAAAAAVFASKPGGEPTIELEPETAVERVIEPPPSPSRPLSHEPAASASTPSEPGEPVITSDISRLFSLLNLHVGGDARGTIIEFISSHRGEGTSTIAREFAQICAMHSDKPVLLLDLDLRRDKQYTHFSNRRDRDKEIRRPGGEVQLGVDLGNLVRFDKDPLGLGPSEHVITAHRVGDLSLHVTRVHPHVRERKLAPHMTKAPAVWDQLRRVTAVTVVDSPPFTESFDGLSVSGLVDQVIVVVEAESTRTPVVAELCDRLTSQNASIAGAVFNKRRFYIPRFIYRWI